MKNQTEQELAYILSPRHLRLLDNIFRKHNLPEFQIQILDWVQTVLADEREEWNKLLIFYAVWKEKKRPESELRQKIKDMSLLRKYLSNSKKNNSENIKEPERYYPRMLSSNGFNTIKLHL